MGDAFFYLAGAENADCGLGPLGFDSDEAPRVNGSPGACGPETVTDYRAQSENFVFGYVNGTFSWTWSSDDMYQSIREEREGSNALLEHQWIFLITGGDRVELHIEGYRSPAERMEWSLSRTNGATWEALPFPDLPQEDDDMAQVLELPDDLDGSFLIRVKDEGLPSDVIRLDRVWVDQMFVRVID
ncbi:hypothetical protein ABI59_14310 [Acidobacteria bacterium Mor1]|nr:hypothetical protein ABI59_14310 [Acidobacteria bacterium Mor1]